MIITAYILPFSLALIFSICLTKLALSILPKYGFMDRRETHSTHTTATPRGGGIVLFIVFTVLVLAFVPWSKYIFGFLLGGVIVFLVNFLDDAKPLSPFLRLGAELLACLVVIAFGIGMENISNPLSGEAMSLIQWSIPVSVFGVLHHISPLADIFTIIWIMTMINMMNWIDGLDGLASGVGAIAGMTLFGLSLLPYVNQPSMATTALILVGALLGFLVYNYFPARIKLGDSGSTFLGYSLAVLAIISSGKIATFFLVLGLPFFDLAWVIFRRVFIERKSPFRGDKKHFHHRLLQAGLTPKQAVIFMYVISALFGGMALVFKGAQNKLFAIVLMLIMLLWLGYAVHREKHKARME